MTKFYHIVQVHPVENGEPNLHKVIREMEYTALKDAEDFVLHWNELCVSKKAVYVGMVNDETGELV